MDIITNGFDSNDIFKKDEELADVKHDLRKKGLVPVLDNDTLRIYKVKSNENLNEIIAYFEEEYKSVFEEIVCKTNIGSYRTKHMNAMRRAMGIISDVITINKRPATKDEIWKEFGLDDEIKRKEFHLKNAMNVEVDVPINDEVWVKGYRKERIDEVVNRIAREYEVKTCEKASKIAIFLKFIDSPYYNLDLIARTMCTFFGNENISFSTGSNVVERHENSVRNMSFSDTENELSEEEKISCIKKMLEGFNIECVFESKIEDVSDFQFETMVKTNLLKPKEAVLDFAKHNSDIINDENVSKIINQINKTSVKRLTRK